MIWYAQFDLKWFCAFYYDHFYFIYIIYRSECKENILASLSEESKIKRRRRTTIGIQITAISWILEFFGGIIALGRFWMFQTKDGGEWADRIFSLFGIFICMVLIPLSYLLNNEAVKVVIQVKGWSNFITKRNVNQSE